MATPIKKVVAANLREIREAKRISQSDLAKTCKLSLRAISRAETQPQNLTIETLEMLAKGLGVTVADLTYDESLKAPPPTKLPFRQTYPT
jgi:transcriptional regulator with XRE-family HTH domain